MDKLTAILHLPGRQPVEVEIMIDDVLAVDGPGGIRFTIEPKGFTFETSQADQKLAADDEPPISEIDPIIKEAGLTLADVPTDPAEGWSWLLKHCPQLFDGIFVSREPYAMYLKPQPVNQLERDVTKLLPIADTLRRGDKWNQSAIAQELGWPNTGGSYRPRLLKIIEELERRAA